jgi:hypothetical protein
MIKIRSPTLPLICGNYLVKFSNSINLLIYLKNIKFYLLDFLFKNKIELSIKPYKDDIHRQLYLHYFCPLSYLSSLAYINLVPTK